MPKNNASNFDSYFKLPNPGLRAYFDRVEKGQPDIYETPFAKGESLEALLKEWEPFVESLKTKWPTLVDFENDLKAKVGPMSVMKALNERMDDIDHYYEDILLSSTPVSDRALLAVISEFSGIKGLTIRDVKHTVEVMKKSTNSGSPYFMKRRTVLDETVPFTLMSNFGSELVRKKVKSKIYGKDGKPFYTNRNKWVRENATFPIQYPDGKVYNSCAVLGWRGQEGGPSAEDVKQRVVWMFPFAVNIAELQFYQPLIESCQKLNLVPAWVSMESVDQRITAMFDTKGPNDDVVCTDFSRFDQHFNPKLAEAGFRIYQSLIDMRNFPTFDWLFNVMPIKYRIPLAYDYGCIRTGHHGMASGSGGTNADETFVHRALQYEAAQSVNARLNPNSQCLGDDGVLTYPGINVEDVIRSYSAHGQEMNKDKQYVSKHDCVYLRRWHHTNYRVDGVCVGVYSTYRALGRLKEQERFYDPEKWGAKMVALRELSILENLKYHPLREQFVSFCMKKDKFRLGLDIPNFLDDIASIAREATELMPDFLGYTKTLQGDIDDINNPQGINNWWVVQYLKSKR